MASQHQFKTGNSVKIYKEKHKNGVYLLQLYESRAKNYQMTDCIRTQTYGLVQALPQEANNSDSDIKHLLLGLKIYNYKLNPGVC